MPRHTTAVWSGVTGLESTLGRERLEPYLAESRGDRSLALDLYLWNSELCAAVWELLAPLEVAIRNSMAVHLDGLCRSARSRASWSNHRAWWSPVMRRAIREARERAERDPPLTEGKLVAQLPFGFWVNVLRIDEQVLWVPGLSKAFPNSRGLQRPVAGRLSQLNDVRNDIAHHHRLWKRGGLDRIDDQILEAADWVSHEFADWLSMESRVQEVLAQRPRQRPSARWGPART